MNDRHVIDELTRAADAQPFAPADPAEAIRRGSRARHRRRTRNALTGLAAVTVAGTLAATQLTRMSSTAPSTAFEDPGDRTPFVAAGGPLDGYPDLVVRVRGARSGGAVSIEGFGWPLHDMETVSDADGNVARPDISKVDAETMCLPMLNQAAPDVPDAAWRHSESWIDDFPTRAGLVTVYEAEHAGRPYDAWCTLPGDFSPRKRPDLSRVPAVSASTQVLRQCSYQGHIDFSAWRVGAADRSDATLSAALVSPEGYVARCVLSSDERQRVTQLTSTLVDEASPATPMVYGGGGTRLLTLVGAVGPEADRLEVTTGGITRTVPVADGVYAAVVPVSEAVPAYDTVVRVLDVDGAELAVASVAAEDDSEEMMLPTLCFTTIETGDDGC